MRHTSARFRARFKWNWFGLERFETPTFPAIDTVMAINRARRPRPPNTVVMVRITFRHRAEQAPQVLVVEHHELKAWIHDSGRHMFSVEAEFIGLSEIGQA